MLQILLICSQIIVAKPTLQGRDLWDLGFHIQLEAVKHAIQPQLIRAIIEQESMYNTKARSHCNARGLMQLMPYNIKGKYETVGQQLAQGTKFFKSLLTKFESNVYYALGYYYAGKRYASKHGQWYAKQVLKKFKKVEIATAGDFAANKQLTTKRSQS